MIDLKELLDDRSATPAGLVQHQRLQQVRGRITTRRRRRITAGGAFAAVLALVLTGYALTPAQRAAPDPATTPSAPTLAGFPEYAQGSRVVAAARSRPGEQVNVAWTPTTLDIALFTDCATGQADAVLAHEIKVNGHLLTSGTCGVSGLHWPHGDRMWAEKGVEIGKPAVFTMTALRVRRTVTTTDGESRTEDGPVPAGAVLGLAVGTRLPFTEYPLPARPDRLPALGDLRNGGEAADMPGEASQWMLSHPNLPLLSMSRNITWRGQYDLRLQAQTPGLLHVLIDGVEVYTGEWWTYEANEAGTWWSTDDSAAWAAIPGFTMPEDGDIVTVTVVPEHFTGTWQLRIVPLGGGATL